MTRIAQHKIVEELLKFRSSMSAAEQSQFDMLIKRNRDDEEFDSIARGTMVALQEKYIPKRSKKDVEDLWKKFHSGKRQ